MILGAHVSTSGGVINAIENAVRVGCETFQIFTKNQNQWREKSYSGKEAKDFASALIQSQLKSEFLASHDSYLINLCAPDKEKLEKSRTAFVHEIRRCDEIGIPLLIFHPGSHLGQGEEWGIDLIAESLVQAIAETPESDVRLLIESTAGQGTNLGYRVEQLKSILDKVNVADRMGLCLDTCHMFTAGYDIRDAYDETFDRILDIIGLENLYAFHLNDSKKELASRVDRHEIIGRGFIGNGTFKRLMQDGRFSHLPGILEVPGGDDAFRENLTRLKEYRGLD